VNSLPAGDRWGVVLFLLPPHPYPPQEQKKIKRKIKMKI